MTLSKYTTQECPDSATLMELARAETGLDDFGDDRLRAPLEALLYSFRHDAWPKMTPASREIVVPWLASHLANRLRVVDDRKRYTDIAKVAIRNPFIVVGPPRSGSTLLHTLLSLDPKNIAPTYCECLEPSPPLALGEPTPARIDAANARIHKFLDQIPNIYIQHSYLIEEGASAVGECGTEILIMAMTTKGLYYYYPLDSYREYLLTADHSAALAFHHSFLQHAQWGREDRRWALKAADHMVWLGDLHAQYPDANLLWTHRDLAELLGSCASVMCTTRGLCGPVAPEARRGLAQEAVELERRLFQHGMRVRDAVGEDRFYDVSYHDVMTNPVRTVERIYERFGLTLSRQAADNIRDWVARNPQTKHGVHRHSPEDFGLEADLINRQFEEYRERFGFGFGVRPSLSV
ncbi:MAG: sulfotransferase [Rhodospirillaceae bacterium]|nr:MAG: sulfotransferase [Rhodospirillaceae bacterium]